MFTFVRYAAGGIVVGFFATTLALIALPHFYSHAYELLLLPAAGLLAGAAGAVVTLLVRAIRRRRRSSGAGKGLPFGRRFAIINVWRPLREPVLSAPLALCDARSVAPGDLIASERRSKDRIGEIQQVVFNPEHRWYYFAGMGRDEVLLIKTYDSAEDGRARFTIHTAFDDPTAPADAPPRLSIESRTFAFF